MIDALILNLDWHCKGSIFNDGGHKTCKILNKETFHVLNRQQIHAKAVFSLSDSSICTCQYPDFKSKVKNVFQVLSGNRYGIVS